MVTASPSTRLNMTLMGKSALIAPIIRASYTKAQGIGKSTHDNCHCVKCQKLIPPGRAGRECVTCREGG